MKNDKKHELSEEEIEEIEEIEEYKKGKILYEEVLTILLKQANIAYIKNEFATFCYTLQSIWNNCYDRDRTHINAEVKRKEALDIELGYTTFDYSKKPVVLTLDRFNEMMETTLFDPQNTVLSLGILNQRSHGAEWRRAYQIMQEALRTKYQGPAKKFTKDKIQEDKEIKEDKITTGDKK